MIWLFESFGVDEKDLGGSQSSFDDDQILPVPFLRTSDFDAPPKSFSGMRGMREGSNGSDADSRDSLD